jgi:hypothetical protein
MAVTATKNCETWRLDGDHVIAHEASIHDASGCRKAAHQVRTCPESQIGVEVGRSALGASLRRPEKPLDIPALEIALAMFCERLWVPANALLGLLRPLWPVARSDRLMARAAFTTDC